MAETKGYKSLKKASKRSQGKKSGSASLSDKSKNPKARQEARGMGTEYANAVENLQKQAEDLKGSDVGFLGVEKVSISVQEFAHSLIHKKK